MFIDGEVKEGGMMLNMNYYLTQAGAKFIKNLGEDTTVPRKKWNPIYKFRDVKRGIEPGYVNPKGGDMTTIDPRSKLPMGIVRLKARGDLKSGATRKKGKIDPDSNEGAGQDPEI